MNLSKNRSIVFILATGGLLTLVMIFLAIQPIRAAGPWYVTPGGDDGNDCLSPGAPCATINGAIGKATSGDTIYVASGTYTGTGDGVVLLDKDATLSGGWDEAFTTRAYAPPEISVSPDELTSTQEVGEIVDQELTISNGDGVTLTFSIVSGEAICSQWNLTSDFRVSPDEENPNRDSCGNPDVWHFMQSTDLNPVPQTY